MFANVHISPVFSLQLRIWFTGETPRSRAWRSACPCWCCCRSQPSASSAWSPTCCWLCSASPSPSASTSLWSRLCRSPTRDTRSSKTAADVRFFCLSQLIAVLSEMAHSCHHDPVRQSDDSLYLSEELRPYIPSPVLRSADQLLLVVPQTRLKLGGEPAFSVVAPKLWNMLHLNIRQACFFYLSLFYFMWVF